MENPPLLTLYLIELEKIESLSVLLSMNEDNLCEEFLLELLDSLTLARTHLKELLTSVTGMYPDGSD